VLILTFRNRHDVTKGKAPIETVSQEDKAEQLKNPKVEDTDAATSVVRGDEKFKHTAAIASGVDEQDGDEYGQATRLPASTKHSSSNTAARPTTLEKMQARTDSSTSKRSTKSSSGQDKVHVLLVEDNVM
jgi:hypothetical protein